MKNEEKIIEARRPYKTAEGVYIQVSTYSLRHNPKITYNIQFSSFSGYKCYEKYIVDALRVWMEKYKSKAK